MQEEKRVQTKEEETIEEVTDIDEDQISNVNTIFEEVIDGRLEESDYTIYGHDNEPIVVFESRFKDKAVSVDIETMETETMDKSEIDHDQLTRIEQSRVHGGD